MRGDRLSYWAISLSKEYRSHLLRPSYNTVNARVRMLVLAGGKAMVELDSSIIDPGGNCSSEDNWVARILQENLFELDLNIKSV